VQTFERHPNVNGSLGRPNTREAYPAGAVHAAGEGRMDGCMHGIGSDGVQGKGQADQICNNHAIYTKLVRRVSKVSNLL
jgi:hypothetical protein